jgi:hypothetical protein
MANSVPFRTTPQLGPQLDDVFTGMPYWDLYQVTDGATVVGGISSPSYKLGNKEVGNDGHDYIWVQASANIASASGNGTQVLIDEPAFTAAAGSGGWYAPPGVAITSGQYFHARKGALDAP